MKRILSPLIILLLGISCARTNEIDPCQSPTEITSEERCYNPMLGLALYVEGYRAEGWEWRVFVVDDTTSTNLNDMRIRMPSSDRLILHDSLLRQFPMIHVQAGTYCGDSWIDTEYYSFIKRESGNCTVWARKAM
jgi:hypothetical protein